jgi:hypothetical protein
MESFMKTYTIAVYGAGGHTGRFVAAELERRRFDVIRVRRPTSDGHPLTEQLSGWRYAGADESAGLDRALDGADAVINCAGPFAETAFGVIEAALRRKIHYFDVCAEQRTTRLALSTYGDDARRAGVVVMPAMAFYGGLADLLATAVWDGRSPIERIDIGVALDSWHPTSGTRITGARNTARRVLIEGGGLVPLPDPAPTGHWTFPSPFGRQEVVALPFSEIISLARHLPAAMIRSFMNVQPLRDLRNAATPPPRAADASGRSAQQFVMDVVVTTEHGRGRILAHGRDIYAVSAPLVAEACARVLAGPPTRGGTYVPGELFDAAAVLSALAPVLDVQRQDAMAHQLEVA